MAYERVDDAIKALPRRTYPNWQPDFDLGPKGYVADTLRGIDIASFFNRVPRSVFYKMMWYLPRMCKNTDIAELFDNTVSYLEFNGTKAALTAIPYTAGIARKNTFVSSLITPREKRSDYDNPYSDEFDKEYQEDNNGAHYWDI